MSERADELMHAYLAYRDEPGVLTKSSGRSCNVAAGYFDFINAMSNLFNSLSVEQLQLVSIYYRPGKQSAKSKAAELGVSLPTMYGRLKVLRQLVDSTIKI